MPKSAFDINRKTASRLLDVSIRTVDRYVRSGKLRARQVHGRIILDKRDVKHLKRAVGVPIYVRVERKDKLPPVQVVSPHVRDSDFYKDLYEESRRALAEYQHKLEQANYRIGQLEFNALPNPSPQKFVERRNDEAAAEFLKKELAQREKEISLLQDLVKREKANRTAFSILTYLLLVLVPLMWYFLR